MRILVLLCISLALLAGCSTPKKTGESSVITVKEINPDKLTALTRQNLLHLSQVYDLSPILFTNKIHIDGKASFHAFPILTLDTRQAEHPHRLLAQFIHLELHWWTNIKHNEVELAIKDLNKIFAKIPHKMAKTPTPTYLMMIIGHLELKCLSFFLGEKEARNVFHQMMKKDRTSKWIYNQILSKNSAIKDVLEKHQLIPRPF